MKVQQEVLLLSGVQRKEGSVEAMKVAVLMADQIVPALTMEVPVKSLSIGVTRHLQSHDIDILCKFLPATQI